MPSRAHLFFNARTEIKNDLKHFIANKCRRQSLLASIGGQVEGSGHQYGCCDVCTDGKVLNSRLDMLASKVCKRKSKVRRRRRTVSPSLEAKLLAIREVLDQHGWC